MFTYIVVSYSISSIEINGRGMSKMCSHLSWVLYGLSNRHLFFWKTDTCLYFLFTPIVIFNIVWRPLGEMIRSLAWLKMRIILLRKWWRDEFVINQFWLLIEERKILRDECPECFMSFSSMYSTKKSFIARINIFYTKITLLHLTHYKNLMYKTLHKQHVIWCVGYISVNIPNGEKNVEHWRGLRQAKNWHEA